MKKTHQLIVLTSAIVIIVLYSCVEPFEIATQNFEDSLVIEATITNEFKYQEIKLSRTYPLESDGPSYEINASVSVVDDAQNVYNFQEIDSGKYRSVSKFSVLTNRDYHLSITTNSGKNYASIPTQLTSISSNYTISAIKETNIDGVEGITIYTDSYDPTANSKYYRFEYEETYKIIAPFWSPLDAFGVSPLPTNPDPPPLHEVYTLPRTQEEETCYKTLESTEILQTDTDLLVEDRVTKFPITFLPIDDFKITHRYSIMVRQYVQTLEASTFYSTLNKFSGSGSLFSQQQQGFIVGNLFSVDDPDEKVIGYFEVASALSQRIFFNFEDFFPNETKPPHIVQCNVITPDLDDRSAGGSPEFSPLIKLLLFDDFKFVAFNDSIVNINKPYFVVRKECGDCTSIGSNIVPEFWID